MPKTNVLEEKISIVKEIAGTITSTSNLHSITNLILDLALSFTKAKSGSILLLDNQGDLVINAARGIDQDLMQTIRVKVGDYICGRVARDQTPLLVKNIETTRKIKRTNVKKYKTKSFICSPILMKDKLLGVININDKIDESSFSEDDFDLINILANQASISLEHARLVSELRLKASELDERNKGLIDSDILKTEFITRISHELRTPLNSIKGAVYYLKEKKPSVTEQSEFINIVSDEADKLICLLNELLSYSGMESKYLPDRKKLLSLKDILDEAISAKTISDIISANNLTVQIVIPSPCPDIIGEKISILQAFIHVIDGLTKCAMSDDSIEVRIMSRKKSVKIVFLLKGRSLPDNELPLIFDERALWYGVDVDKTKMKFYLARKAFETHKGIIKAANSAKGFTISLDFIKNQKTYRNAMVNELMSSIIPFVADLMSVQKCSLMLFDDRSKEMTIRSSIGLSENIIRETRLTRGEGISGWVADKKRPLLVQDIEKNSPVKKKNAPSYSSKSFLCMPINLNDKTIGVMNFNNKTDGNTFAMKDQYLASVISDRIANIIGKVHDNMITNDEFKLFAKGLEALSGAEKQYKKKNGKMSDLVMDMMQDLKKDENEIKIALYSSKLYDLGITQIDENILSKSGSLSEIEAKIIKTHPFPGVKLIESVEYNETVKNIILHHHERYDGAGYPSGLKGENIPFISRVLAVADSYTAMVSDRPYRKAVSRKSALKQIKAGSGTHFDPVVVNAFARVV
jgi:HD-GYP domain-containing protein (c-di-GMP phosphodiesterase class II)/signal transduction histidine kinase